MANILFGYKNHCLESGVTFTPSSEHADHDADNLGIAHPSEFWRATTISSVITIAPTFPASRTWDLIALLYAVASPHQNIVPDSWLMTGWTATNVTPTTGNPIDNLAGYPPAITLQATGTGNHRMESPTWVPIGSGNLTLTGSLYVSTDSVQVGAKAKFRIGDGTNYVEADIDLSDGSINGTASNGWTLDSSSSTAVTGSSNVHRIELNFTTNGSSGAVTTYVYVLNSSYTASYSSSGEGFECAGPVFELASTAGSAINNTTGQAAHWNGFASTWNNLALNRDLEDWYSVHGWVHSYEKIATPVFGTTLTVKIEDRSNETSQFDLSNLFVGLAWQPARNIRMDWSLTLNPATNGRSRILAGRIGYASEADAYTDALPMAQQVGVGSRHAAIADGGQEFRSNRELVLVILDPDESTYGQEQIVYGYLDAFNMVRRPKDQFDVAFQVTEVIP